MDWITVLDGAASIGLFPRRITFTEALQESGRQCVARAKKDGISEDEALRCISAEYRLGQNLTFVSCLVALAVALLSSTLVSDTLGFVLSWGFPLSLCGPKIALYVLRDRGKTLAT